MALIIRIDVDRPYGKQPVWRHFLSRLSSDFYFPRVENLGYLQELKTILNLMNQYDVQGYIFFRRCTLPSDMVIKLIKQGRHEIGLHLENSRSFDEFENEKRILERHVGRDIKAFSKHGSGGMRYGRYHYAPYEPEKYIGWARQERMKVFFGNLEDPTINPMIKEDGFSVFPAAFWLEPYWRNTDHFTIDWLLTEAKISDIVLLVHPENMLESPALIEDFKKLISSLEIKILR